MVTSDIPTTLRPIPDIMDHLTFLLKKGVSPDSALDLGADILNLIEAQLTEFNVFPTEHDLTTVVLWAGAAHFMDVLSSSPRLLLVSPEPGSGKSNVLKFLKCITPYAVRTENATPAWVYHQMDQCRRLDGARPTIMLDEFDCLFTAGKDNYEMRKIIDAGAYLGGTVDRHIGKHNVSYDVFGAMALAGNMLASDVPRAIRSRSLCVQMQRAGKGQVPKRWYGRRSPAEVGPLYAPLERWAEFVHGLAKEYQPVLPEEIWSRDADNWTALLVVSDLAGGDWPQRARAAAVTGVTGVTGIIEPSEGVQLLWQIHAIFNELKCDKIFTIDLLAELRTTGLFRWAHKEPLPAALRLAQILSAYGVRRQQIRIGKRVTRGYTREDFEGAWAAYPEPSETGNTGNTGNSDGAGDA
jgi:hypothetical protein